MEKVYADAVTYDSYSLKKTVETALSSNLRVYCFQESELTQVFIEEEGVGVCTVSTAYGFVSISTVHKPCKSCGTGFQVEGECDEATLQGMLIACKTTVPHWGRAYHKDVVKYLSFSQKIAASRLTYRELISR